MGGKCNKKVINFRATEQEEAQIEQLIKASGKTKQEYLLAAALAGISAHTHFAASSLKSSPDMVLMLQAASESSKPQSDITLKGTKAAIAISSGTQLELKDKDRCLYHDGHLWLITKTANGSQKILTQIVAVDPWLFDRMLVGGQSWRLGVNDLIEAASRFEAIVELGFRQDDSAYPDMMIDNLIYNSEQRWLNYRPGVIDWIEEHKPSLAETVAALTPVADEIAIEPTNEASSPIDEPTKLTNEQFRAKFGITDNVVYMSCLNPARVGGWTAPDGQVWFSEGTKNKARWTTVAPVAAI